MKTFIIILVCLVVIIGGGVVLFYYLQTDTSPDDLLFPASEEELKNLNQLMNLISADTQDKDAVDEIMAKLIHISLLVRPLYSLDHPLITELELQVLLPVEMKLTYSTLVKIDNSHREEFFPSHLGYSIQCSGSTSSFTDMYESLSWATQKEIMSYDYNTPAKLWLEEGEHAIHFKTDIRVYRISQQETGTFSIDTTSSQTFPANTTDTVVWSTEITDEAHFTLSHIENFNDIIQVLSVDNPQSILDFSVSNENNNTALNTKANNTEIGWPSIIISGENIDSSLSLIMNFTDMSGEKIFGRNSLCFDKSVSKSWMSFVNPFNASVDLPLPDTYSMKVQIQTNREVCMQESASVVSVADINYELQLDIPVTFLYEQP